MGLLVAVASDTFLFQFYNKLTQENVIETAFSTELLILQRWLFGIIGGIMVGFHILMIYISENAFKNKEKWAYHASWFGLISWFIIDSSISLYFNAWHNVVMVNLVALIGLALPLIMTRKAFK